MHFLLLLAQNLDSVNVETPTTAFLKAGILGACIVVLAGVVVYLYRDGKKELAARDVVIGQLQQQIGALQQQHVVDLAAIQKQRTDEQATIQAQRVSDAQQVSDRLLRVNESVVAALTNVTSALEAQRESSAELKAAFKEFIEELRRLLPLRRG